MTRKGLDMYGKTVGTVTRVSRQWWLKVNTKAVRAFGGDGAQYPHVVTVKYTVDGKEYTKLKWLSAGTPVPALGASVTVSYCKEKPAKAIIEP